MRKSARGALIVLFVLGGLIAGFGVAVGLMPGAKYESERAAERLAGEAVAAGWSGRVSYEPKGDFKSGGLIFIDSEFEGLEPREAREFLSFLQAQRMAKDVRVILTRTAWSWRGIEYDVLADASPGFFADVFKLTAGRSLTRVSFDGAGLPLRISLPPCADAACRLETATDVLEIYPKLTRLQQRDQAETPYTTVCLDIEFGPEPEDRLQTCTGMEEEADPQRLATVLETGQDFARCDVLGWEDCAARIRKTS